MRHPVTFVCVCVRVFVSADGNGGSNKGAKVGGWMQSCGKCQLINPGAFLYFADRPRWNGSDAGGFGIQTRPWRIFIFVLMARSDCRIR